MKYSATRQAGFTLVEMIVSIALFAIVMLVAVGAMLALTAADKKAQALQSVMNNLNISLDNMVRNLRMGRDFHCGPGAYAGGGTNDDCPSGGNAVTFNCSVDVPGCENGYRWGYAYDTDGSLCNLPHGICENENVGPNGTWYPITSPEVNIQQMALFVVGTQSGDNIQPKVIIELQGQAGGGNAKTSSTFHIQATAVQRELDL